MVEIRHRYTRDVLFTAENTQRATVAVEGAIKAEVSLVEVNLAGLNLGGANFEGVNLSGGALMWSLLKEVSFEGANLRGGDLSGGTLWRANFRKANLEGADFTEADLEDADFTGANLEGADLTRANLTDAVFEVGALKKANFSRIRGDLYAVLATAKNEVSGLLAAVREGRIDGQVYSGACACLVGTIANLRGCSVALMPCNPRRPIERWFHAIRPGMVPQNSPIAALTAEWIMDWMIEQGVSASM